MVKDFLAFLGLVFLTLLILIGVTITAHLYTTFDLITLPDEFTAWFEHPPDSSAELPHLTTVEWSNPLESVHTATLPSFSTNIPVPTLTPSPVPPLPATMYRDQVIDRMKQFVTAMENWRNLNNELVNDNNLAKDSEWLEEMKISLQVIEITGTELADVGPAPPEYGDIDKLLDQIPAEVNGLHHSYLHALQTGNIQSYINAGNHFNRIKEMLAGAVNEMLALGWLVE